MLSAFWWLQKRGYIYRPCPSSPGPLYENKVKCSAFDVEMIFHSHANKTHFTKNYVHLDSFWRWGFLELGSGPLVAIFLMMRSDLPWVPEVFLACGEAARNLFYKDLTETGNRARIVSGTQGRSDLQFREKLEYFVVLMKGLWQHALLRLGQICVVSDRENCLTYSLVYCLST